MFDVLPMYRGHTVLHLTSTKKPGVHSAKNINTRKYTRVFHIGPDQGAAAVMVRASLADPARPSDRYHGTTDTYDNDSV